MGLLSELYWKIKSQFISFHNSRNYWETRYASGGDSGKGSSSKLAKFKAEIINQFIETHQVESVIEFGCGDGQQLTLLRLPRYYGYDVSPTAINMCKTRFCNYPNMFFRLIQEYNGETADLALSLDVIYHLVEEEVYQNYMNLLFKAATRYVVIYSSNFEDKSLRFGHHIRHRKFTEWVDANAPEWMLIAYIPNRYPYKGIWRLGSFSDFYIYEKIVK